MSRGPASTSSAGGASAESAAETASAGTLRWGALAVVWRWEGDRFAHRVSVVAPGEGAVEYETTLWESREGTSADRWPASPPFQQLSVEPAPDGAPRAFLVGQSGVSHWSAAVEAVFFDPVLRTVRRPHEMSNPAAAAQAMLPHDPAAPAVWRPAVLFDVAARVKEPPGLLGSAYRAAHPEHAAAAALRLRLHFDPWPLPEDVSSCVSEPGPTAIVLRRLPPAELKTPATLRWRYLWRWE